MITFERQGAQERIEQQALLFAGITAMPHSREPLFWVACSTACSICAREDIPEEMESAVAVILSVLYTDGIQKPVSSVKRGDTAITYAAETSANYRLLLTPFVRLRTV